MKTLIAALTFSLFTVSAFCQQTNKTATKAAPKAVTNYKCPMCGHASATKGDCPKDKIGLVKVGDYYCPDCYMTSTKAGKCQMCGVAMKKMEATGGTK